MLEQWAKVTANHYMQFLWWYNMYYLQNDTFNAWGGTLWYCEEQRRQCLCVCVYHSHTYPLIVITLLLNIIKITYLISISSPYMAFSWGGKILLTCILLLYVSPSSSLFLSLSPPTTLPSFHSSSLSPPLPTWTQDNHPKARFSIKSVTHPRSHRAICGIMHTKHSDAKLFFDSPVRKITARTHFHLVCVFLFL